MLSTVIFYATISIIIIFMGHSVFKYFTELYTEELTKDLHTQTNTILSDINQDMTKEEVQQPPPEIVSKKEPEPVKDDLEDFMDSLDEKQSTITPQSNLPDQLLEFNSNDMSNAYSDYSST